MDKLKFSQNELLEMESLEVRGGASANAMAQGTCVNEAVIDENFEVSLLDYLQHQLG